MGPIDLITFVLSLLYIYLAIRNNYWCFVVAIVQCSLWAYLDFFQYRLLFDGVLQIFYILMAIWGIYLWQAKDDDEAKVFPITYVGTTWNGISILIGLVLALCLAYGSTHFLEANMPYLDALTTIFAIIATIMLVHRKIDNWIYFVFGI